MTKKELEDRVAALEREVRSLQQQLNNVVRTPPAPVYVSPPPWPGNSWIVSSA